MKNMTSCLDIGKNRISLFKGCDKFAQIKQELNLIYLEVHSSPERISSIPISGLSAPLNIVVFTNLLTFE